MSEPAIFPFEFASVARIVFGRGKVAQLGEIVRPLGSTALVVHNGDDRGRGGPVDRAAGSLSASGVRVVFHRQRGEPTIADVDAALAVARHEKCEVLIGLGGGSAIDAAKAAAGLLTNGGDCLDYMEVIGKGRKITEPAAPWVAVPTTAGTGAEVTRNAVIGSPAHKFKASIRSDHLFARVALVDAELHVGTPPAVTAASGMDALCQCVESFTARGASRMTDAFAESGADRAMYALEAVWANGGDMEAREAMALAALLSGIALTNAGLGAAHGFAAPLGANFPVPHGVACARLLPRVVVANTAALRAEAAGENSTRANDVLTKYLDLEFLIPGRRGRSLVAYMDDLVARLGIPPLREFGVCERDVAEMVSLAKRTSSMKYNPVVLGDDVLAEILRSAL